MLLSKIRNLLCGCVAGFVWVCVRACVRVARVCVLCVVYVCVCARACVGVHVCRSVRERV